MEFGQCAGVLYACVAIGLPVLSPFTGYPKKPNNPAPEITVSRGNYDPRSHPTESVSVPEIPAAAKPMKDAGPIEAARPEPSEDSPLRRLLPFADANKPTIMERAYLDAFILLKDDKSCSRLYGGPSAIVALNELVRGLTPAYIDRHIAVRMMGETKRVQDFGTGRVYRLFEKAEINLSGSFYKGNTSFNEAKTPQVGYYQPNTREARVTILLHELGHLLRGDDKKWILPDDGKDEELSRKNTRVVVTACRDEIDRVVRTSFERELVDALVPAVGSPTNEIVRR